MRAGVAFWLFGWHCISSDPCDGTAGVSHASGSLDVSFDIKTLPDGQLRTVPRGMFCDVKHSGTGC